MRWPKWIRDTTDSVVRAGKLNGIGAPRLHQGTDELFPGMRAAPLHRRAERDLAPLGNDSDAPNIGGPRD